MDHADHVALLQEAVVPGGTWADIGAGTGAFTLALADLLGPGGRIVAVDRDRGALAENLEAVGARFASVVVEASIADLTGALALPILDGLVAANSLHFVTRDRQVDVVLALASHLRPGGKSWSSSTTPNAAIPGSRTRSATPNGIAWQPKPG